MDIPRIESCVQNVALGNYGRFALFGVYQLPQHPFLSHDQYQQRVDPVSEMVVDNDVLHLETSAWLDGMIPTMVVVVDPILPQGYEWMVYLMMMMLMESLVKMG